jgi:5'-nucleotidase
VIRRTFQTLVVFVLATAALAAASQRPLHVMIINDDGIDAPGIQALTKVMAADPAYRVTVVAPAKNQSGTSNALIIRREIEIAPHAPIAGAPAWSVDATPATVARIGILDLLKNDRPDLVLSGINRGENAGLIAWYSGTVAAARESTMLGVRSIAFSLALNWHDPHPDYSVAARWAKEVVDAVRAHGLPAGVFLNVNIPKDESHIRGFRLMRGAVAVDLKSHFKTVRQDGKTRWVRAVWVPATTPGADTDTGAMAQGWVTVVPLTYDQTAFRALAKLGWVSRLAALAPLAAAR